MNLFRSGPFESHSGITLPFKIECDALSDDDLATLAGVIASRFRFSRAFGVPRGGLRFAGALQRHADPLQRGVLIVDDVLTTGRSMETMREIVTRVVPDGSIQGVVIFARGASWPSWVTPIFTMSTERVSCQSL